MAGLFESLIGHVAGHGGRKAKKRNLELKRQLGLRRNVLQRRNFLRQARGAIAQNMVAAGSRAGGLDSSGFQGAQASLQTQREAETFRMGIDQELQNEVALNEKRILNSENFAAKGAMLGSGFDQMISQNVGG